MNKIDKGDKKVELEPIKKEEDVKLEVVNPTDDVKIEVVKTEESAKVEVASEETAEIKTETVVEDMSDRTIVVKSIKDIEEFNGEAADSVLPVDNYVRKLTEDVDKNNRKKVIISEELFRADSSITYEYSKTIGKLDLSKIRGYKVADGEKTISFLFYENDFYAVNRINYKNGYMYSEKEDTLPVSENLNKIIRKIPNVAKARNILHIENIEARIYDMTEYILLLERENIRVIKVSATGDLSEMKYEEYPVDKKRLEIELEKLAIAEEEKAKEENSIKNKWKEFTTAFVKHVINPIKAALAKIGIINDVKMLSDGKHSIFDKMGN